MLRKRVKSVKERLPGGTMAWIRSHLYLPVLALVLAFAHAAVVPFRGHLSSGKVLFVLGVLVSVAGMARHHLIGIQKAAINVNVAVGKLTTGQPRAFRRLIADYTDHRRTRDEVDAAMAQMDPALQETWAKIKELTTEVEQHFPREGGQRWHIRQYKLWRALHPPLTIALFLVLAFHVWDVLGGTRAVAGDEEQFATASECAGCHSDIFDEWASSTMAHAPRRRSTRRSCRSRCRRTSASSRSSTAPSVRAAHRPRPRSRQPGRSSSSDNAHVCIDCHAPVGGSFTDDPLALLPFGEGGSPVVGQRSPSTSRRRGLHRLPHPGGAAARAAGRR